MCVCVCVGVQVSVHACVHVCGCFMAVARGGSGYALEPPPAIDYTLEFHPLVSPRRSCSDRVHTSLAGQTCF